MNANVINELKSGLSAAYINGSSAANLAYKPAFVSNNPEEGKKVISSVEDELLRCEEFQISVAFITMGGVTPLLQTLKELEEKGVQGQKWCHTAHRDKCNADLKFFAAQQLILHG